MTQQELNKLSEELDKYIEKSECKYTWKDLEEVYRYAFNKGYSYFLDIELKCIKDKIDSLKELTKNAEEFQKFMNYSRDELHKIKIY